MDGLYFFNMARTIFPKQLKDLNFIPLLLGNDINSYSVARAFFEAYGLKPIVLGKYAAGPNYASKIVEFKTVLSLDTDVVFLQTVNAIAKQYHNKSILLMGCGDSYVELISKHKEKLASNIVAPVIDYPSFQQLTQKEFFYQLCSKHSIPFPKTFVYKKEMGRQYELGFGFSVIVKPSDGPAYWKHPFDTQKKVYKLETRQELDDIIEKIYQAGYLGSLIIQDFIPGDDSSMRVLTCYSDKTGKVKLAALGHVILEEHTPRGLGNHAVIINETNSELVNVIKNFLEIIGYVGFSNFDIKYDARDNTFRVFELNARQGRSNFYVSGAGYNIARYVVEDYIEHKKLNLTVATNAVLWSVVPLRIAFKYTISEELKNKMRTLIRDKKTINPLWLAHDCRARRLWYLIKWHIGQFGKYKKYYAK